MKTKLLTCWRRFPPACERPENLRDANGEPLAGNQPVSAWQVKRLNTSASRAGKAAARGRRTPMPRGHATSRAVSRQSQMKLWTWKVRRSRSSRTLAEAMHGNEQISKAALAEGRTNRLAATNQARFGARVRAVVEVPARRAPAIAHSVKKIAAS